MPIRRRNRVRRTAARRVAARRASRPSAGADRESIAQSLLGVIGDRRPAMGKMTPTGIETQPEGLRIPPLVEPAPEASPLPRPAAPMTRRRK